jgi:protease I
MSKKVLLIIAPENFRDEECFVTRDVLESKGAEVTVASSRTGDIKGMLGGTIKAEKKLEDAKAGDYDAVVFVGGTGAAAYFNDPKALEIAIHASQKGKVVAAICIAPSILANAGLLKGRKATAYPSEKENLERNGAKYTGDPVTRDGRIVTGKGPEAAQKFAEEVEKSL